ncbi:hypothetical protein GT030_12055 [Streptomyces sp. SID1328]|nr:hypothetical protein [Streptomyces sp. SID1328]
MHTPVLGAGRAHTGLPASRRHPTSYKSRDPELAIVVSAVKATVKGGLGKLRERPRGEPALPYIGPGD